MLMRRRYRYARLKYVSTYFSMTTKTHDAFAFASLISAAAYFSPDTLNVPTLITSIIAADIGAAIPDMDTAGNRLWEMLPQGHVLGRFLRRIFYKHRTLTHSFIGVFGTYKLLEWGLPKLLNEQYIDPTVILWSVMIGIISHLISDSLTEEGIPLLFPLRATFGIPPVKSIRIKTGKWFEFFVVYPALWVYVAWFVHKNESIFLGIVRSVIK